MSFYLFIYCLFLKLLYTIYEYIFFFLIIKTFGSMNQWINKKVLFTFSISYYTEYFLNLGLKIDGFDETNDVGI